MDDLNIFLEYNDDDIDLSLETLFSDLDDSFDTENELYDELKELSDVDSYLFENYFEEDDYVER